VCAPGFTGPANCGKTFLLNPLNKIYHTFTNPASNSFAWVGAENAEVVFLNDFRWSPQIIVGKVNKSTYLLPSRISLRMLHSRETRLSQFCTTTRPLTYVKNGCLDYRETEVMNVRWKVLLDEPNSTKPTARFGSVFIVLCATNFTSRRLLNYLYLIIRVTLRNEHTR
jgi:hypothetical protein